MNNAKSAFDMIPVAGGLVAATSADRASFFGFYDICPWSPEDDEIVLLTCPPDYLEMPAGEKAEVQIWNPERDTFRKIGETAGWNWQHGARTRWLKDGTVLFNDVEDDRQCARVVSAEGGALRTYDTAVSALHPDETYAVAANYARLAEFYPTYGYGAARNPQIGEGDDADGLWRLDMATGEVSLMLSYRRICADFGLTYSRGMFVTHPDFSPSGRKIAFFLIEAGGAGTTFMRLLVYDADADTLLLVSEEKASHPAWIDDNRLWVWARESSAMKLVTKSGLLSLPGVGLLARLARRFKGARRNALLSEGFFIYETDHGSKKTRIAPALLTEDGHFSRHPVHEVMLGDTYPDDSGYLTLLLHSLATGRRVEVARIFHGVETDDPMLRCDLHPRWNRAGNRVSVDVCSGGVRRVAIIDVTPAIAAALEPPADDPRTGRRGCCR